MIPAASHALPQIRALPVSHPHTSLSKDEVKRWQAIVRGTVDGWLRAGCTHNQKGALLEIKAMLALMPEPGTVVVRNLDEAIALWFRVARAVDKAPLYPLERFADRLTSYVGLVGEHPRFAELTEVVDRVLAKRTGPFAPAAKARDRAVAFMEQKAWRKAAGQLHRVVHQWFADETLWGSVASMLLLSECYRNMGLGCAAKQAALAAAFCATHSNKRGVLRLLPRALDLAAAADYAQGAWLGYLGMVEMTSRAHTVATESLDELSVDEDEIPPAENDSIRATFHLAVIRAIAQRIAPNLTRTLDDVVQRWNVGDEIAALLSDGTNPWATASPEEIFRHCVGQIGAPPFSDVGPERAIAWHALGIEWRVIFSNRYEATARAEEFAAMLQVVLVELAEYDLCILPCAIEIAICVGLVDKPVMQGPVRMGRWTRWQLTVAPEIPESAVPKDLWTLDGAHQLAAVLIVLQDTTVAPLTEFQEATEQLFKKGLVGKMTIARPYHRLFQTFVLPSLFHQEERTSTTVALPASIPVAREAHDLAWNDSPGPGYSDANAAEWIANRYRNTIVPVALTVQRLRQSAAFQASVASLRSTGWKDWHLLLAVMNVVINYRARRCLPLQPSPESVTKVHRALLNAAEDESSIFVPDDEFTEDKLRMQLELSMLATLKTLGLEVRQRPLDILAISKFLSVRYRYFQDDVSHPDWFSAEESPTGDGDSSASEVAY